MTAEIVVANREGVALAADSAVTFQTARGEKVWPTANKIFEMSRCQPVGVMVFGGADIMGVPWDTVIKMYRDQLGDRSFPSIGDYVDDFIAFLEASHRLFPPEAQRTAFAQSAVSAFVDTISELRDAVGEAAEASADGLTESDIRELLRAIVDRRVADAERVPPLPHVSPTLATKLARRYRSEITAAIDAVIPEVFLDTKLRRALTRLTTIVYTRIIFSDVATGVVIAGFGDDEHFPRVESIMIEAVVADELNYYRDEDPIVVTAENDAHVKAFAQRRGAYLFMEGIDERYSNYLEVNLAAVLAIYIKELVRQTAGISKARKKAVEEELTTLAGSTFAEFMEKLGAFRYEEFTGPVLEVVGVLAKEELGVVAETLVSLQAFRQRVSLAIESVGGPIDVALISKGDGFVWMQRKSYFDLADNPRLMAR